MRLGRQVKPRSGNSLYLLHARVIHLERFLKIVAAAAESQHKEAFEVSFILAGTVLRDLVNRRLIDADKVPGEQNVLLRGRGNVGGHLHIVALTAEVHRALLVIVIVHYLLVLVPHEIALGGAEVGGRLVHGAEHGFQVLRWRGGSSGIVYFTSYDGNFYAVDVATGQLRWKFQTVGEHRYTATHLHGSQPAAEAMPDPFDVYLSSPLVAQGAVFFGSGDGNVYSLHASDGSLNWKFHTNDVVHASPVIADGKLYIGSWDSYFYALDTATGRQLWRFKTGEDPNIHNQVGIQSSAVVADGLVYFGCRDSNLYALDASTGEKKWAYNNKGSWVIASPIIYQGNLYFATSDSGMFHAVNAKTGTEIFSLKFSGWPTFSSPAIARGILYVGSHSGKLFAINLAQQKIAWEFQTEGARENGALYTEDDGTPKYEAAYAGDFYDDLIVGVRKLMTVGGIYSSPVLVDGVLYFGSTDGYIYALI